MSKNPYRPKRRLLALAAALGFVLALGFGIAYMRRGGWTGIAYECRLAFLNHVAPLAWPSTQFSREAWRTSPIDERYRFYKSVIKSNVLLGATPAQIEDLLGGRRPAADGQYVYPLRRADLPNLWWVLTLEVKGGRVLTARRAMAWLDP